MDQALDVKLRESAWRRLESKVLTGADIGHPLAHTEDVVHAKVIRDHDRHPWLEQRKTARLVLVDKAPELSCPVPGLHQLRSRRQRYRRDGSIAGRGDDPQRAQVRAPYRSYGKD
jgi:hypothetical protein